MRAGGLRGAVLALALLPATAAAGRSGTSTAVVPLPSPGNLAVARLTLLSRSSSTPRLTITPRTLPAGAYVVSATTRTGSGRYAATVVVVVPPPANPRAHSRQQAPVRIRLPAGWTLATAPVVSRDVLYANDPPAFELIRGGTGSVLAGGRSVPRLPIPRLVEDAQQLALDRSIPLADAGLLDLPYVSVRFGRPSRTLQVTIGLTELSQVNAVELRFPPGIKVTRVSGPAATQGLPMGSAVQLIATRGVFENGVPYTFTLDLSAAPRAGDEVGVRASIHYFESSLPFSERFALS